MHGFQALRAAGVEGVLVPVAWGLVEPAGPGNYEFGAYRQLATMLQDCGLKMQVGRGGQPEAVSIPIPLLPHRIGRGLGQ